MRPLLGLLIILCAASARPAAAQTASEPVLKAAFLLNFAKFADWRFLHAGERIVLCVLDDEAVGNALTESARGQTIDGHAVEVWRLKATASLPACQVLFTPGSDGRDVMTKIAIVDGMAVLTVSDARGFAQSGGMIELFEDNGRMRFAVNVEAAERAGLKLSSRLLGLAKIVKGHAH